MKGIAIVDAEELRLGIISPMKSWLPVICDAGVRLRFMRVTSLVPSDFALFRAEHDGPFPPS
jgi:hypothetical protein